ncbi:LOW QUALITY PROTEIN: hypothetical protein TorRG33x02_039840, partial [Trema orientale]
ATLVVGAGLGVSFNLLFFFLIYIYSTSNLKYNLIGLVLGLVYLFIFFLQTNYTFEGQFYCKRAYFAPTYRKDILLDLK